jgi:hypothetical protein
MTATRSSYLNGVSYIIVHNRCQYVNTNNKRLFSSIPKSPKATLRKLIRPFLMACHPDAMSSTDETDATFTEPKKKHMSRQAKEVNLKAVQILNGLIDTCDDLITRCSTSKSGQLPELKQSYEIEFMLPSGNRNERGELKVKRKRGTREELTLRAILIEFPKELREEVRHWALTPSRSGDGENLIDQERMMVGVKLKRHVEKELMRLLTVAGLEYEQTEDGGDWEQTDSATLGSERKQEEQWTLSDHFLHELGIEPMEDAKPSAFYGRPTTAAPPGYAHLQSEREKFMNSIKWDSFREKYDDALEDFKADSVTRQLKLYNASTKEGRDRRERLVSLICGRVRIWVANSEDKNEEEVDIPEGLDVVAQLVAIRRLSTLLNDNFDYLNMERMGRMWENLVIVLVPPRYIRRRQQQQRALRDAANDEFADVARKHSPHPGRKLNKWERRMKRREKTIPQDRGFMRRVAESHFHYLNNTQVDPVSGTDDEANYKTANDTQSTQLSSPAQYESGYKFSYGSQSNTGEVTAYVPIDFKDDELIDKLHTYLYDYFDNSSPVGFLSYGPDGVTANIDELDDDVSGEQSYATK